MWVTRRLPGGKETAAPQTRVAALGQAGEAQSLPAAWENGSLVSPPAGQREEVRGQGRGGAQRVPGEQGSGLLWCEGTLLRVSCRFTEVNGVSQGESGCANAAFAALVLRRA